jgi:hypothetical protein
MHSEKSEMKMDKGQDKAMIKKAFKQHDLQEHKGGKGTSLKLKKGGMSAGCGYDKGGKVKKFAMGGYMGGATLPNQQFPMQQQAPQNTMLNAPATPGMPYAANNQTAFKKGGAVKMAMGGAPVDPRMMAKKKAPRGMAPKPTGMMPPRPPMAPEVAPTMPMKKGGMAKCGYKDGGMAMVEKDGKMVPDFAADGKGKMKHGGKVSGMHMMPNGSMMKNSAMMKGGMAKCATGGMTKGESPIQRQAKGGAKVIKMAKGGSTSSRGDGCAIRGKTRA